MKPTILPKPTYDYVYVINNGEEQYVAFDELKELSNYDKLVFVYDCDEIKYQGIDIEDVINDSLADEWDEYEPYLPNLVDGFEELKTFIDEWNKKQILVKYVVNKSRIIYLV